MDTEAKTRSVKAGKGNKLPDASAEVNLDTHIDASSASIARTHTEGDRHSVAGENLKRRSGQPKEVEVKSSKKRSKGRHGAIRNRVQGKHPFVDIKSSNAHMTHRDS